MGTGGSKGAAAAAAAVDPGAVADGGPGNAAERMGWRRSRMQGLSCFCFSCSASPDEEKEIKGERHRGRNGFCVAEDAVESKRGRLTDCLQFLLPCRGRVISSPSSDAEQREHYLDSASSSSDSDVGAVATAQTSGDPLSRPRPRFCFISDSVISSLGSATSPSTISPTNPSANAESSEDHGACAREGATRTRPGAENLGRRQSRRNGAHDPLEGSVRFSRTLSVGRLRDRVLRRSTFSESLFAPSSLEDGQVRALSLGAMDSANRDDDQRATFLERRRRLRSQVWALQRLGSRMESVPGHERSCLLCSQPSAGRCTCGTADGSNPRSSISRIVMLAEALFEVLDEIHQQAVVLASRPSVSSMGSVPAPREAVDCIPLRIHRRMDEAAQCYICLLDYEEGDAVRVLPCGHEFHQPCVDKWLTDIHRVCPLCRADVCISELTPPEKPARCS